MLARYYDKRLAFSSRFCKQGRILGAATSCICWRLFVWQKYSQEDCNSRQLLHGFVLEGTHHVENEINHIVRGTNHLIQ